MLRLKRHFYFPCSIPFLWHMTLYILEVKLPYDSLGFNGREVSLDLFFPFHFLPIPSPYLFICHVTFLISSSKGHRCSGHQRRRHLGLGHWAVQQCPVHPNCRRRHRLPYLLLRLLWCYQGVGLS